MAYDHANDAKELSKWVYKDDDGNPTMGGSIPPGFNPVTIPGPGEIPTTFYNNDKTGYYGEAYHNPTTNTLIIVSRGTEPDSWKDWQTNNQMLDNELPKAFEVANNYYLQVTTQFSTNNPTIICDGHSMGGTISQFLAAKYGVQAYTFDAFGAKSMLEANNIDISTAQDNIVNFVTETDVTGNSSDHVGQTLYVPGPELDCGIAQYLGNMPIISTGLGLFELLDYHALKSHDMDNFDRYDLDNPDLYSEITTNQSTIGSTINLLSESVLPGANLIDDAMDIILNPPANDIFDFTTDIVDDYFSYGFAPLTNSLLRGLDPLDLGLTEIEDAAEWGDMNIVMQDDILDGFDYQDAVLKAIVGDVGIDIDGRLETDYDDYAIDGLFNDVVDAQNDIDYSYLYEQQEIIHEYYSTYRDNELEELYLEDLYEL